jgi:hypothetical protein
MQGFGGNRTNRFHQYYGSVNRKKLEELSRFFYAYMSEF